MANFYDELQKTTNQTARTENGAVTNNSTLNPLLDFFSLAGAMRANTADAVKLFRKAYAFDHLGSIRTLFYLRDIRGGVGERNLFRVLLAELKQLDDPVYIKILKYIPEYGRYDDLPLSEATYPLIARQLAQDEKDMAEGKSISLLSKWLPSGNASSRVSRDQARKLAKALNLTEAKYRKRIVVLRKYIKLLEQQMSAKQWGEIDYSKLPSQAHRKHVKAFHRHDETRYKEFLGKAVKGEAKLNAGTVFAYEVFDMVRQGNVEAANAVWANLPDYTHGSNAIVLADVSGSMQAVVSGSTTAMSVSVSLALYFAERNQGPFQGKFMTFSENPQVVEVMGNTLQERLRNIETRHWDMNTNLEAALLAILQAGQASGAQGDDMPKVLYVISDMELDQAVTNPRQTNFENAKQQFADAGLPMPGIVFWNVMARQIQSPATKFDSNVTLVSGLSQSIFRHVMENKSPVELMLDIINGERYNSITI